MSYHEHRIDPSSLKLVEIYYFTHLSESEMEYSVNRPRGQTCLSEHSCDPPAPPLESTLWILCNRYLTRQSKYNGILKISKICALYTEMNTD